jgi:hypothetical protein
LHAHGRWFSPGTRASSTIKTGRHDIAEILLKVALKHKKSIKSKITFVTFVVGITKFSWFIMYKRLIRKDMDVNEHERLFNITLRHILK